MHALALRRLTVAELISLFVVTAMIRAWILLAIVVAEDVQPRNVITIESHPARKVFGSVSAPEGSPWCQGRPMYWLVGHQRTKESPFCLTDQGWERNALIELDRNDALNDVDGPTNLDRHDCTRIDADGDGVLDLVCGVGADKGEGNGFTELYITESDGTLTKVPIGHGLHKYPTLRVRLVESLSDPFGNPLIFFATHGTRRADNETNSHKMFRRTLNDDGNSNETLGFFFEDIEETSSPVTRYTDASSVVVADFNGDKIDDLLVGNRRTRSLLFVQGKDGYWKKSPIKGWRSKNWRSAKVGDITGDGILDLIVSDWGGRTATGPNATIRIFEGLGEHPYFDFTRRGMIFERALPFAAPDIELFDANNDGIMDVYVVQTDEVTKRTYCAGAFNSRKWWGRGNQPPANFTPPYDEANDLLLLGRSDLVSFDNIVMKHSEPGCGFKVEAFGTSSLLLAQGTRNRPGHNLLLEW